MSERNIDQETGEVSETITRRLDEWPKVIGGIEPLKELELRGKLAAKLSKAYVAVAAVVHDDNNTEHKYSFASAETIYKACRKGMSEVGLAILPFMGDYVETPIFKIAQGGGQGDRRGAYMQVNFDYVLMDTETGYGVVIPWVGEVMEYGDKAFNKASTNATKYMLRTLFLLPTDKDDDPDRASEEGRPATRPAPQSQGRGQDRRPAPQADQRQAPAPQETPEAKAKRERQERANVAFNTAYPFYRTDGHELQGEQKAKYQEFKARADANLYATTDVILYSASKGEASHDKFMFYASLPTLEGVTKKAAPAPAPPQPAGDSKPPTEVAKASGMKSAGEIIKAIQGELKRHPKTMDVLASFGDREANAYITEAVAKGAANLNDVLDLLAREGGK